MKSIPTLRQLRYLIAVVDRCHFGQAAEACLVSQSTLSAGIQELEDLLGAPLLERTKRSVVPTPLGRDIADRARTMLKDAEDLVDVAHAACDPMAGSVHLGVIPTIAPFMLPQVMERLRTDFPALKLYLREDQTARLLAQLQAGELDAVLLALPYPMNDIETIEVARDPFWVVCPPGHGLCSAKSADAANLMVDDLLLLEDGHCLRGHALAACGLEESRRNSAFKATSLHTLVQMVGNGLGVTLLPQMALEAGILGNLNVGVVPLEGEAPFRRIGLAWRRTSGRKETFRRFAAVLKSLENDRLTFAGSPGVTLGQVRAATTGDRNRPG